MSRKNKYVHVLLPPHLCPASFFMRPDSTRDTLEFVVSLYFPCESYDYASLVIAFVSSVYILHATVLYHQFVSPSFLHTSSIKRVDYIRALQSILSELRLSVSSCLATGNLTLPSVAKSLTLKYCTYFSQNRFPSTLLRYVAASKTSYEAFGITKTFSPFRTP